MSATHIDPPRQPAGVPAGGQFATQARSEPTLVLAGSSPMETGYTELDLDSREFVAAVTSSVRTHAMRAQVKFVGQDDMVQETIENVLRNRSNNHSVVVTSKYIHQVAYGVVAQAARGHLRQEDHKAIGIWTRRSREMSAELGRELTSREEEELAASIRDTWHDQRRKPSVDFLAKARTRQLSLDAPVGGDEEGTLTVGETLAATLAGPSGDDDQSVEPGTAAAAVLSGQVKATDAKRAAWNTLAEVAGTPTIDAPHLSGRVATRARAEVGEAGGVVAAAELWRSGEQTPATDALFAPFAGADDATRDDVADFLVQRGPYAEELWASAMRLACTR